MDVKIVYEFCIILKLPFTIDRRESSLATIIFGKYFKKAFSIKK